MGTFGPLTATNTSAGTQDILTIPALPSSSIGAFDASLLEMTQAYVAFGNEGRLEGHPGGVTLSRATLAGRERTRRRCP